MALLPQTVSHYRIVRQLGKGGMGEVFLAEDARLNRQVALKILPPQSTEDPTLVRRFTQEARSVSALSHPNIAQIYDVGEEAGIRFIAMEYVEGQPLTELVHRGPLEPERIIDIGSQIADALDEAHTKRIIHRDIKAQNILVTARGQVKVLDFGLAKLVQGQASEQASTDFRTDSGVVLGTVDYMSPEQALGRPVDHRSDLFSLGVVLYLLATGRLPFAGISITEKIDRILHQEPDPITRFSSTAPTELERIIRKCLQKEADRRYQTARELLVDLRNLQSDGAGRAVPAPGARRFPILITAAAGAVLAVTLLLTRDDQPRGQLGVVGPNQVDSIAVLPLASLSTDQSQEYFAEGLTELLTTELAKLPTIKVISQSSSQQYRGEKAQQLAEIARDLKVNGIVRGTVVQAEGRMRVTAQLIHAPSGAFLWAETYERARGDLFALQSEIARSIAQRVQGRLTPQQQQRFMRPRAVSEEATQWYLKGRHEWNKRTLEGMKQALDSYQQALQSDPQFALAYAGIADYYSVLPFYSSFAPKETFPKAKEAALKAVELDPSLAEAHASLAYIKTYYEWDWQGAEQDFRRALELRPSSAEVHHRYSRYLTTVGRHQEAMAELKRAQELDPLSKLLHANLAMILYFARRYDDAIEQLQQTLELDPKFSTAHWGLGLSYQQKGMMKESIAALEKAREISPRSVNALASLGNAYAASGERAKARAILADLRKQSRQKYVSAYQFALIHAGLGENDEALRWLEQAHDERATLLTYAGMDPRFDPLRSDPRFTSLLRRIRLPV